MEEEQKTNNPHDKGYKRIFKVKKNFLDFIQKYVALDWMMGLTVEDVELIDKEFITDQFETYESDFVYDRQYFICRFFCGRKGMEGKCRETG